MTQIWAIFYDAYRNLNSKKLFWITLLLSGFVVLTFAFVGINEKGLTILTWELQSQFFNSNFMSPDIFYKWIFTTFGIGLWLSWVGTIMALVSTAGIFPDLMSEGSIDLAVSKPISRFRLFMTQYAAGLLFVALQVSIFTLASFLVIGFRGGVWEPGLFIAIPLVLCLFSYLFSFSVLVGVKTRSTVAAILLTMVFWCGLFILHRADVVLTLVTSDSGFGAVEDHDPPEGLILARDIVHGVATVLPNTTWTIDLLSRSLVDMAELPEHMGGGENPQQAVIEEMHDSPTLILGSSLAFEFFILMLAARIFCRRDY